MVCRRGLMRSRDMRSGLGLEGWANEAHGMEVYGWRRRAIVSEASWAIARLSRLDASELSEFVERDLRQFLEASRGGVRSRLPVEASFQLVAMREQRPGPAQLTPKWCPEWTPDGGTATGVGEEQTSRWRRVWRNASVRDGEGRSPRGRRRAQSW